MIRILLVDDQPTVRQGLQMRMALESDLAVVGEAGNGEEALALVPALHPDVVLMDVAMPGIDGIEATRQLRALAPHSAVIMLSINDSAQNREKAAAAGATAFVCKEAPEADLLDAIRAATA